MQAKPHELFATAQGDFIRAQLQHLPEQFIKPLLRRYNSEHATKGASDANLVLLDIAERTRSVSINLAADDDEIRERASRHAKQAGMMIAAGGLFAGRAYSENHCYKLPDQKRTSEAGQAARLSSEKWWRGQLRKKHGRKVEAVALDLNLVNKRQDIYASTASVQRVRSQRVRNRYMLESCYAVNEHGEAFTLAELADVSVSNPVIRRGELMTRIVGMEQYANAAGHVGEFWTITTPSRMHAALSASGQRNAAYDGTTPRAAQRYLSEQWAKARSALKRAEIELYGFRVCEPHHDGTPHWHCLFFLPSEQVEQARAIVKRYALEIDGNEPGAQKHRFKPVAIDSKKGTAAGYIAKYISKAIDAYGLQTITSLDDSGKQTELTGVNPQESIERVAAWASTWGIRQFQQIGGAGVTVWRELRRIETAAAAGTEIEQHQKAADLGDWFGYTRQQERAQLKLFKEYDETLGAYMEPKGWTVKGVMHGKNPYMSRIHTWRVESGAIKLRIHEDRDSDAGIHGEGAGASIFAGFALGQQSALAVRAEDNERKIAAGGEGLRKGNNAGREAISWSESYTDAAGQRKKVKIEAGKVPSSAAFDCPMMEMRDENGQRYYVFACPVSFSLPWTRVNNCTQQSQQSEEIKHGSNLRKPQKADNGTGGAVGTSRKVRNYRTESGSGRIYAAGSKPDGTYH